MFYSIRQHKPLGWAAPRLCREMIVFKSESAEGIFTSVAEPEHALRCPEAIHGTMATKRVSFASRRKISAITTMHRTIDKSKSQRVKERVLRKCERNPKQSGELNLVDKIQSRQNQHYSNPNPLPSPLSAANARQTPPGFLVGSIYRDLCRRPRSPCHLEISGVMYGGSPTNGLPGSFLSKISMANESAGTKETFSAIQACRP